MTKILVSSKSNIHLINSDDGTSVKFLKIIPDQMNWICPEVPPGQFFGMTWIDQRLFVTYNQYPSVIVELDKSGNIIQHYSPPPTCPQIIRAHQILAIDRKIVILSSDNDMIFLFDIDNNTWAFRHMSEDKLNHLSSDSIFHPNSMRYLDEELHVLALLHESICGDIQKRSCLYRYTFPEIELIDTQMLDTAAHQIWKMCDEDWFLDSTHRLIRKLKRREAISISGEGWLRGAAVSKSEIIIGSSPIATRELRPLMKGKILVLDSKSYRIKKSIKIDDGNVNELRIICDKDLAHNVEPLIL